VRYRKCVPAGPHTDLELQMIVNDCERWDYKRTREAYCWHVTYE